MNESSAPQPEAARSLSSAEPAAAESALAVNRPDHALRSLLELSRDLRVSLNLFETTDLLLFNLMGQVGTARGSLWLTSEQDAVLTIVRCHGFNRRLAEGALFACQDHLLRHAAEVRVPHGNWIVLADLGDEAVELLHQANIALIAPLRSHGELIGWIALGSRVDGSEYGSRDLEGLDTALGMIVMALENTRLFNRVRETNRGLRAANQHLKELDRLKSELLNNVNHELRTPIAVVLGALECAIASPALDPAIRKLLKSAHECSGDLAGMIANLQLWSECVEDRVVITLEVGNVTDILKSVYQNRLPGITEELRELRLEVASDMPLARFDPARVSLIVDELLDNAVKFTPRGTCLTLRAGTDQDETGHFVRIDVEDNGPGIPNDRMSSLFRSFEQVDGSMTRRVGGLGLGLAFSHLLAQRMGGSLTVVSQVGSGTTFTIRMPLADLSGTGRQAA